MFEHDRLSGHYQKVMLENGESLNGDSQETEAKRKNGKKHNGAQGETLSDGGPNGLVEMSRYEYHAVPFIGQLKKGSFDIETAQKVSDQLQALIDEYEQRGWEFYCIDKIDVEIKPGRMTRFLGGSKVTYLAFSQVIFRRPATESG